MPWDDDKPKRAPNHRMVYRRMPLRKSCAIIFENSGLRTASDLASTVLALVAVILYVADTYITDDEAGKAIRICNLVLSVCFSAHYLLHFWLSDSRVTFILHYQNIIDCITIFPGYVDYFSPADDYSTFLFLRALRIVRVLRVLRLLRATRFMTQEVHKRLFYLAFTFSSMVFCSAGFFYEIEKGIREAPSDLIPLQMSGTATSPATMQNITAAAAANQSGSVWALPSSSTIQLSGTMDAGAPDPLRFHQALYWSAVTIATVGYGDLAPQTWQGQMMVILLLFLILSLIPYQTNKLLEALSATNPYLRAHYWNHKRAHVLVTGSLRHQSVATIVDEFFHPDHGYQDHNMLLLGQASPDRHMLELIKGHLFSQHLTYAQGSPHVARDLGRVAAERAKAIFILVDRRAADPRQEDTEAIMGLLSLGHYLQAYNQQLLHHRSPIRCLLDGLLRRLLPSLTHKAFLGAVTPEIPRIFIQLLLPESHLQLLQLLQAMQAQSHASRSISMSAFRSHHSMFWASLQADLTVICIRQLQQLMLAQSCLASPGVMGLLSNLAHSSRTLSVAPHDTSEWMGEYRYGSEMEVYEVPSFPAHLHGHTFDTVAQFIYDCHNGLLLGVLPPGAPDVCIAPHGEVLAKGSIGFVIASEVQVADDVSLSSERQFEDWLWQHKAGSQGTQQEEGEAGQAAGGSYRQDAADAGRRMFSVSSVIPEEGEEPSVRSSEAVATSTSNINTTPPPSQESHLTSDHLSKPPGKLPPINAHAYGQGPPLTPSSATLSWDWDTPRAPLPASSSLLRKSWLRRVFSGSSGSSPRLPRMERNLTAVKRSTRVLGLPMNANAATIFKVVMPQDQLSYCHQQVKPVAPADLVLPSTQAAGISNHILVVPGARTCSDEVVSVVANLRLLKLRHLQPVVILLQSLTEGEHVEQLARLESVWFLLGSPRNMEDLQRAGADRAAKALLLGGVSCQGGNTDSEVREGAVADADVIFAYQHLKTLNRRLEIYCQVAQSLTAAFLGPSLPFSPEIAANFEDFEPRDTLVHASGAVLLPEVFDSITCQAFHSCHFYQLLQHLLSNRWMMPQPQALATKSSPHAAYTPRSFGGSEFSALSSTTTSQPQPTHEAGLLVIPVQLELLPSPTYGLWFQHCLQHRQLLCLGLYRHHAFGSTEFCYVFTNPPADTPLHSSDRAFVIANMAKHSDLASNACSPVDVGDGAVADVKA